IWTNRQQQAEIIWISKTLRCPYLCRHLTFRRLIIQVHCRPPWCWIKKVKSGCITPEWPITARAHSTKKSMQCWQNDTVEKPQDCGAQTSLKLLLLQDYS